MNQSRKYLPRTLDTVTEAKPMVPAGSFQFVDDGSLVRVFDDPSGPLMERVNNPSRGE
jgi:hypothetical protein